MTAQNNGPDGVLWTDDDVYDADLNAEPAFLSADVGTLEGTLEPFDRVRPFISPHPGGVVFSQADGSVQFVSDSIDRRAYINRSHIKSGEVSSQ